MAGARVARIKEGCDVPAFWAEFGAAREYLMCCGVEVPDPRPWKVRADRTLLTGGAGEVEVNDTLIMESERGKADRMIEDALTLNTAGLEPAPVPQPKTANSSGFSSTFSASKLSDNQYDPRKRSLSDPNRGSHQWRLFSGGATCQMAQIISLIAR